MNILMFGHHSHTGFGVVTEQLATRFLAAGHDVRVVAVNHRGEPVHGPLTGRVWPASIEGDGHGGNISQAAIAGTLWQRYGQPFWAPDVVLVIADMSGLWGHIGRRGLAGENNPWLAVPVFHYCPIEGDNLPLQWRETWRAINPVAMSDYGAEVIGAHMASAVPMIYHGVDTTTFRPATFNHPIRWNGNTLTSRDACRAAFGLAPDRKYVLRADRLTERKFYNVFIRVMAELMAADPTVDAIIHCSPVDPPLNLNDEIGRVAPDFHKRFILTGLHTTWTGLTPDGLAALYNAADVYFSPTGGEGFGLTLAESLACETPVVTTAWAAEREVVAKGGVLVPPLTDAYGEPVRYHSQYGMDWGMPDAKAFVAPLQRLLAKPALRRSLGREGRIHVERSFSWDTAATSFLSLFEEANGHAADRHAA